jgi:uncharacterized membrane protein
MSVGPRFALLTLLALLATAGVAAGSTGAAVPAQPAHATFSQTAQPAQTAQAAPPVENTTLAVRLQPDGDAQWTVSATYSLDTENETAAFRRLATEFEQGDGSLGLAAFREAAAAAADATGRPMEITEVRRTSSPDRVIDNGTGRLTLSFTWTGFARAEGDRLLVGDVFDTDRPWLSGLGPDQRLTLQWPDGYGLFDASPEVPVPRNGTIRWDGPASFGEDGFSVIVTGAAGGGGGPTGPTPDGPAGLGAATVWLGVAVLGIGIATAVYAVVRRREPEPVGSGSAGAEGAEPTSDGGATAADADPDSAPAGAAAAGTGAAGAGEGPADEGVDEELLSDEERVERLLERNDGRMKQATIVKETGWSNAKVSQLLSAMDDDGRIDKLRIGRENLISFPDEDVADIDDDG